MIKNESHYNLKMYIAVSDKVPLHMVPVLVAHSVLGAHNSFSSYDEYWKWHDYSFKKVVIVANDKELVKHIDSDRTIYYGRERTVMNCGISCVVYMPMLDEDRPNVVKYAKTWGTQWSTKSNDKTIMELQNFKVLTLQKCPI